MLGAPYNRRTHSSLPAAVDMLNLMIGESAGFFELALIHAFSLCI